MSDIQIMNRAQFIRELRAYAKANKLTFDWNDRHGKGSHGRVTVGGKFTAVPGGELKKHTMEGILKQLGLPKDAI